MFMPEIIRYWSRSNLFLGRTQKGYSLKRVEFYIFDNRTFILLHIRQEDKELIYHANPRLGASKCMEA